eukprot:gnl/MRDRNA2_/MRDRNA2_60272_c0_seq1.p1 gnl/MRDRNA2_/MRDRNA2_60272_c0~~gnl/MRDRNA2_/MRDRNA2_60272_c0_seq1.p1  ORF type:complete len:170 (-),score=44.38 gnl/MRDRNA2_/MRDRNA2_60272_c0_seq1:344-853(-)
MRSLVVLSLLAFSEQAYAQGQEQVVDNLLSRAVHAGINEDFDDAVLAKGPPPTEPPPPPKKSFFSFGGGAKKAPAKGKGKASTPQVTVYKPMGKVIPGSGAWEGQSVGDALKEIFSFGGGGEDAKSTKGKGKTRGKTRALPLARPVAAPPPIPMVQRPTISFGRGPPIR